MGLQRLTAGGGTSRALAGLALLATLLICVWIGTYQEFVPVGIRGARYTPLWATPPAVAVGLGGTLLALLIYRQGRRR